MLRRVRSRGFIKTIILIIVALVLLKYFFNVSAYDIIHSPIISDIWYIIKSLFLILWDLVLALLDFLKQLVATAKTSVSSLKS